MKFTELTSRSCRFVLNDGRPETFFFCGEPKSVGPYCKDHAALCYLKREDLPIKPKKHKPERISRIEDWTR